MRVLAFLGLYTKERGNGRLQGKPPTVSSRMPAGRPSAAGTHRRVRPSPRGPRPGPLQPAPVRPSLCEGLFQIGDDVPDMLNANGKAHGVGPDALLREFLLVQLRMGGARRVDDKGLYVSHISQQ